MRRKKKRNEDDKQTKKIKKWFPVMGLNRYVKC